MLRLSRSPVLRLAPVLAAALAAASVAAACESARPAGSEAAATVDTLADGTVRVRYQALPASAAVPVEPDLRIGTMEGDPHLIFGDVRGIDADADGTIYVLDYQASEIRAFDPEGRFLRVVVRQGEGPGEIVEANGLTFSDDGTIWIQDHGQWRMIGVTPEGEEVDRFPMPVLSYGYIWNGAVDDRGRFWKPASHSDEEPVYPPEEGLHEGAFRRYLKWYEPGTVTSDSVYLGLESYRTFVSHSARGWSVRRIPFAPGMLTAVNPAGGFWRAATDGYRIARLDEEGDTVLLVEATVEPRPVTSEDREGYVARAVERSPDVRRAAERIAALMPSTKPILASLGVDDEGRLWVGRVVEDGEGPLYDVFTRDGAHARSFRLDFGPVPNFPIRVRDGRLYTLVRDSLDVPYVVRADLPL